MSTPRISIIVPIYNTEKYLPRCLDSLIGQTFNDIEIICVIDGSEDNSVEICKEYREKDPRIIIIAQENQGPSGARNTGITYARGEYIQFCDSDDYYSPKMCQILYTAISSSGADLAASGTRIIYDDVDRFSEDNGYYRIQGSGLTLVNESVFQNTDVSLWNKIFRKSIIDAYQVNFPVGLFYEDAAFFFKYLFVSKKIFYIKEVLYTYVRHQNSIMSNTFNKSTRAIDHVKIIADIQSFITNNELKGIYVSNVFLWIIVSYTQGVIMYGLEPIYESAVGIAAGFLVDVPPCNIKNCPYINRKEKDELLALKERNTELFLKIYYSRPRLMKRIIKKIYLLIFPKVRNYDPEKHFFKNNKKCVNIFS